jgi:hypothetical protein
MSIMETRQDALEGKMSEVIATTTANTEALHELKHVFTKYMSRFKDNSEGSPSVSKSAVDSNIPPVIKAIKCNAPSDLPLSKEQRDHVVGTLPNQGENVTSVEGSLQPTGVPQPPKQAHVAKESQQAHVPLQDPEDRLPEKTEVTAPKSKATITEEDPAFGNRVVPPKAPISSGTTFDKAPLKAKKPKDLPARQANKDGESKKGSTEKKAVGRGGDSSKGMMLQAVDGLLEAGKVRVYTLPQATVAAPSPRQGRKLPSPSPPKIDARGTDVKEASTKVKSDDILESPKFPFRQDKSKLLVFNVHGTLLDCSSVEDPNPNPSIRYTLKTLTRRVVCRPWMVDFLSNCFQKFEVAFWRSKSSLYMEEVVPAMLGRLRGDMQFVPLFVWSQKEYQPVEFEGGAPILWGKPLERVYEHWSR